MFADRALFTRSKPTHFQSISLPYCLDCTACDVILFKPYRDRNNDKFRADGPISNFIVSNLNIYFAPIIQLKRHAISYKVQKQVEISWLGTAVSKISSHLLGCQIETRFSVVSYYHPYHFYTCKKDYNKAFNNSFKLNASYLTEIVFINSTLFSLVKNFTKSAVRNFLPAFYARGELIISLLLPRSFDYLIKIFIPVIFLTFAQLRLPHTSRFLVVTNRVQSQGRVDLRHV